MSKLCEALRGHLLCVHEEGTAGAALVLVPLEQKLGHRFQLVLHEAERRNRRIQRVLRGEEGTQDSASLGLPVAPQIQHDARAREEGIQVLEPLLQKQEWGLQVLGVLEKRKTGKARGQSNGIEKDFRETAHPLSNGKVREFALKCGAHIGGRRLN